MESLAQLFTAYRTQLEAFVARRTRDPQIAADLTQEAFLRLARMPDGEKVEDLPRFLFAVAGLVPAIHVSVCSSWPAPGTCPGVMPAIYVFFVHARFSGRA